jgi:predicted Zn-dependent protease
MLAGNPTAAADAYFKGMQRQAAAQFSRDPPLFWYSVRRSYAAALIAGGEHARAREHLLASLSRWPNDPLALYALSKVVRAGGDDAGADRILKRAGAGWKGDLAQVPLAQV